MHLAEPVRLAVTAVGVGTGENGGDDVGGAPVNWRVGGEALCFRGALHTCYEAPEGELDVEDARDAFVAAVRAAARKG